MRRLWILLAVTILLGCGSDTTATKLEPISKDGPRMTVEGGIGTNPKGSPPVTDGFAK